MAAITSIQCQKCLEMVTIGIQEEDYIDILERYEYVCNNCKKKSLLKRSTAFDIVEQLPNDCIKAEKSKT